MRRLGIARLSATQAEGENRAYRHHMEAAMQLTRKMSLEN
jgi:hypothetical protein